MRRFFGIHDAEDFFAAVAILVVMVICVLLLVYFDTTAPYLSRAYQRLMIGASYLAAFAALVSGVRAVFLSLNLVSLISLRLLGYQLLGTLAIIVVAIIFKVMVTL